MRCGRRRRLEETTFVRWRLPLDAKAMFRFAFDFPLFPRGLFVPLTPIPFFFLPFFSTTPRLPFALLWRCLLLRRWRGSDFFTCCSTVVGEQKQRHCTRRSGEESSDAFERCERSASRPRVRFQNSPLPLHTLDGGPPRPSLSRVGSGHKGGTSSGREQASDLHTANIDRPRRTDAAKTGEMGQETAPRGDVERRAFFDTSSSRFSKGEEHFLWSHPLPSHAHGEEVGIAATNKEEGTPLCHQRVEDDHGIIFA